MIKNVLYKLLLPKLIGKSCESRIPRSGEEGAKVNCYIVALDREGSPYFVATGYKKGTLTGLKWNGNSYANEDNIELSELEGFEFRVTHFYGLSDVRYSSIYDITWHYFTKLVYIKIHLYRALSSISEYFFNKKKLVTKRRMELLQFMLDDQMDRDHDGIRIIDLMTKLYSIRWVLHPSGDDQQRRLEIYLDSLVESGELRQVNHEYVVTGKAISTIERYEEEERRHIEAVKLQRWVVLLTLILVIVGLLQAGLIKLPTLIDFSGNQTIEQTDNQKMQPTH